MKTQVNLAVIMVRISFILLIGGAYIVGTNVGSTNKITEKNIEVIDTAEYNTIFTDSVKQFILSMNISHADIVYAQAVLESSNFDSKLFRENNNMFGMKVPMVRNTVALGSKNGYAYYKNWEHSIIDYALYQTTYYTTSKQRWQTLGRQAYLEKLSRTYAEDPEYIKKINRIVNNYYD